MKKSIAIIGAGPAGSNLARRLDSKVYDVYLIDGAKQRGDKVCGGLLSPDAQDVLAQYDICLPKEILVSPQLFSVRTIDLANRDTRYYRRNYMNLDRNKFDRFLVKMLPETVTIVEAVCKQVQREGDGFVLKLYTDEGYQSLSCDFVVGADGASSVVRKMLFPKDKIQRYVAIQQWFPAEKENPYYSCVFDNATSPSCSWIFFKDDKMVFGGAFESENCREAFESQKQKLVERGIVPAHVFANVIQTEACMVARPHLIQGICLGNENAFLIGEAAGFISPSSLEGISFALSSAEALAQAFKNSKKGKVVLHRYKRKTMKLCLKVKCKCVKRPFMYYQVLRSLILKSGVCSIKMKEEL